MVVDYRETLVLDIHGQRVELLIPHYSENARIIKQHHLTRPNYEYEAIMATLFGRLLASIERPEVLDVGAFIGYYTALAGKLLAGRGRVWAIESNPRHVEVLRETIRLNRLENAESVHAALSDRPEPVVALNEEVWSDGQRPGAANGHASGQPIAVQAETCDALCQRLGIAPNLAKLDVHGYEGKVLGGMRDSLRTSLDYVLLELHQPTYLEKFTPGITRTHILDTLDDAGFHVYYVAGHHYPPDTRRRFLDAGRFAYHPLTRENRGMLLFDRQSQVFVLASKRPLPDVIGPSMVDPSVE